MNDYIEVINKAKPTPFSSWNENNRSIHYFNNNQKIKRNGEEIDLQQYTNENNKDCTIYDVLKNYKGDMKMTQATLNVLQHKVADEMMNIKDLPTALEMMKTAEKTWNELPLVIRKEFNNDVNKFQKDGLNWAKSAIKAREDAIKAYEAKQQMLRETAKEGAKADE